MKKIVLCTTFRDFNGSENDEIQRLFLQSIASQTYSNFELVVTLFGEKNVQREIEKYNFVTRFYNQEISDYRYSLSSVLNNAIEYAANTEKDFILLWTTCDVIYDDNFFQEIVDALQTSQFGTSHPHVTYQCVKDFVNTQDARAGALFSGFDLVFFDSKFLNPAIREILKTFKFYDWGVFEHFLISLAEVKQRSDGRVRLVNIYESSKIKKIENNRTVTNEPSAFLVQSHERNAVAFNKFLKQYRLSVRYFDLTYCHLKFSVTKNVFAHLWVFKGDLLRYLKRTLRFYLGQMTPVAISKILRGRK